MKGGGVLCKVIEWGCGADSVKRVIIHFDTLFKSTHVGVGPCSRDGPFLLTANNQSDGGQLPN